VRVAEKTAQRLEVAAAMSAAYASYRRVYPATRAIFDT